MIIYQDNVTSNWKEFYAFAKFRSVAAAAAEILSLKIKSVNFNVNIFTAYSEGYKSIGKNIFDDISGCSLLLSISHSIVNSPSHAVNLSDLSGYENVSIHVEDSVIQNGKFMFKNKRGNCEPTQHVQNIIEMNNVTVLNSGIVALSANGCFNMSFNKLICRNLTWKKQELFIFRGASLKMKNILIENILAGNNKSEGKVLFFIEKCAVEIQNVRIKDCKVPSSMWLYKTSSVFLLQNSFVKMHDMEVIGNFLQHLARLESSFLYLDNISLSNNIFNGTLCSIEKSNLKLNDAEFHSNTFGYLLRINLKSNVLITNNILSGNKIFRNGYSVAKSNIQVKNVAITGNNLLQEMLHLTSDSSAIIQNNTFTKNNVSKAVFSLFGGSKIQLNYIVFTRNKLMEDLLYMGSNSSAIIKKNILTENTVSRALYILFNVSTIQLHNVMFTQNKLMQDLLQMQSNSSAIIENSIVTENYVSRTMYFLLSMSRIQLRNVTFTRNKLMEDLLGMQSNCSAIIENSIVTENYVSRIMYFLLSMSRIQLRNVTFTRNKLMQDLLQMQSNSSALIQKNTFTENNVSEAVYDLCSMSTIQLYDVIVIQNYMQFLLYMESNSGAMVKNNTIAGNNIHGRAFNIHSSIVVMNTISLENNAVTDYFIWASFSNNVSLDLMRIKKNRFENGIIHIENCASRLANTYIENYDRLSVSAVSVTCTYEGHKYFPSELKNNTIIWNYALSLSIRPIIELTGKIKISNVIVSVSSISEIEVLRYSTKNVTVQRPYYKVFSNAYEISALFISCKRANVKHLATFDTVQCTPCLRDTYTLNNGSLNISSKHFGNKKHEFLKETKSFNCYNCPVGANCTGDIKSKSNFYGYVTKQRKVKFVPCPLNFCCTTDQCKTITSCNNGRSGTLCGRCTKNNTESFFSSNCISANWCKNVGKFWLIYYVYALGLATCLYYMKDLIVLMKTIGGIVSKVFKCFQKEKESEDENDVMISIIGSEEQPEEKISHFTMSGIFALIVSFYQIKRVMAVDVKYRGTSRFLFTIFISDFINLELVGINSSLYCPMNDLNAVSKAFIKAYLLTVALIMASLLNYMISRIYYYFGGKLGRRSPLKPSDRLGVCLIRVLMLNYKNMATVSLILLNCVEIAGNRVLHINGDIKCFEWWQVIVAVFFCTWILIFPLSLKLSYSMFMKDQITFPQLIISLMIPFALVVYHILNRNVTFVALQTPRNVSKVKRILQEMFEESYRLKRNCSKGESIFYETWRLYQRVLLAFVATYYINPIARITFMAPIIILIALSYIAYKPYKPEMYILHWMEVVSILGFSVYLIHNMFRAFLYVYDINKEYTITLVWEAFTIADLLFSPIWVLFWFFIIKPVYSKARNAIKKRI